MHISALAQIKIIFIIVKQRLFVYTHQEIDIKLDSDNIVNKFVMEIFDITPFFFKFFKYMNISCKSYFLAKHNFFRQIECKMNLVNLHTLHHILLK